MAGEQRLFSLTDNPFAQMGLTPRASRDQIEAAPGGRAGWAAAVLLDPYRRLAEEVAWLPGASGQAASEAVAMLAARDRAGAMQALVLMRGLAKANLAADMALRFGEAELIDHLVRAWDAVAAPDVLNQVNADRMISGFPATNGAQVDWALQGVRERHGATAAAVLGAAGADGREQLVRLIERPSASAQDSGMRLVDAIVAAYGELTAELLDQQEGAILDEVAAMTRGGRDGVDRLEMLLAAWALSNRPALMLARRRRREDARALRLVGDMRAIYLDPSAGPGRLGPAGRIASLLLGAFPDGPAIQRMVSSDAARLGAGAPLPIMSSADDTPQAALERAMLAERGRRETVEARQANRKRLAQKDVDDRRRSQTAPSAGSAAREQLMALVRAKAQPRGGAPNVQGKKGAGLIGCLAPMVVLGIVLARCATERDRDHAVPATAPQPAAEAPAITPIEPAPPPSKPASDRPEPNRTRPVIVEAPRPIESAAPQPQSGGTANRPG
jgi:hypothetical protein